MKFDLDTYFKHSKVIETYKNYKSLVKPGFPELNYFGINFDSSGVCSVKFYFAFFRKLTEKEILLFIPHTNDFNKYYQLWEESGQRSLDHTGCTFEIKFKSNNYPVSGFHFRLKPIKESYDLIGYPQRIPMEALTLGTRPGINYEYGQGTVLRKKYYYFEKPEHKSYIADRFKKPFANKIALAEYTESDEFSKVNLWRFDYSTENTGRPDYFNKFEKEVINYFKNEYGLLNVSDGFYENDTIKATYFFNTLNTQPDTAFAEKENYNIDTLKLFI